MMRRGREDGKGGRGKGHGKGSSNKDRLLRTNLFRPAHQSRLKDTSVAPSYPTQHNNAYTNFQ